MGALCDRGGPLFSSSPCPLTQVHHPSPAILLPAHPPSSQATRLSSCVSMPPSFHPSFPVFPHDRSVCSSSFLPFHTAHSCAYPCRECGMLCARNRKQRRAFQIQDVGIWGWACSRQSKRSRLSVPGLPVQLVAWSPVLPGAGVPCIYRGDALDLWSIAFDLMQGPPASNSR